MAGFILIGRKRHFEPKQIGCAGVVFAEIGEQIYPDKVKYAVVVDFYRLTAIVSEVVA